MVLHYLLDPIYLRHFSHLLAYNSIEYTEFRIKLLVDKNRCGIAWDVPFNVLDRLVMIEMSVMVHHRCVQPCIGAGSISSADLLI